MRTVIAIMMVSAAALAARPAQAQTPAEQARAAVHSAVLDYVEGFYTGDTARLVRSVAPTVTKYGYSRPRPDAPYAGEAMSWGEIMSYANGVKSGRYKTPANAPKEVVVFEVQDQTASAKVTAWWGTDYLLLARVDGRWMIIHVLWQSPPPR